MLQSGKMHLMLPLHFVGALQKCICNILCYKMYASNAFDAKMHLMRTFCNTKCYKCILAYIFQRKMFSVHFPLENVQLCKNAFDAKMHLMRTFCNTKCYKCIFATRTFYEVKCSHIFQRKMFSKPKC